jgi:hypothetical protein
MPPSLPATFHHCACTRVSDGAGESVPYDVAQTAAIGTTRRPVIGHIGAFAYVSQEAL